MVMLKLKRLSLKHRVAEEVHAMRHADAVECLARMRARREATQPSRKRA